MAAEADHGTIRSVSPLDGQERIVSFLRLPNYPLIVSVGLEVDEVFAHYRRDRLKYLIAGGVMTLSIVIVGTLLINQNRRLLRSRQILSDAVENISQGVLLIDENRQLPLINGRAIELLNLPPALMASRPSFDQLLAWQINGAEFGREARTRSGLPSTPSSLISSNTMRATNVLGQTEGYWRSARSCSRAAAPCGPLQTSPNASNPKSASDIWHTTMA